MNNSRHEVTPNDIVEGLIVLHEAILRRIVKFDSLTHISSHESLGIIYEEFNEFSNAVQSNNIEEAKLECMDIAVASIWAYLSLEKLIIKQEEL